MRRGSPVERRSQKYRRPFVLVDNRIEAPRRTAFVETMRTGGVLISTTAFFTEIRKLSIQLGPFAGKS